MIGPNRRRILDVSAEERLAGHLVDLAREAVRLLIERLDRLGRKQDAGIASRHLHAMMDVRGCLGLRKRLDPVVDADPLPELAQFGKAQLPFEFRLPDERDLQKRRAARPRDVRKQAHFLEKRTIRHPP